VGTVSSVRKPACLLLAAAVAAACACTRPGGQAREEVSAQLVKAEVATVGGNPETHEHYVLLTDKAGRRSLPIAIGEAEARAIMLELYGISAERPLTHELLLNIIRKTGNRVDKVVIDDLRSETYYAVIYMDHGRYRIDSRPSDAIALALGTNSPIYVASKLLQFNTDLDLGHRRGLPEVTSGLGLSVQELTGDLASAMGQQPHDGVLVSSAEGEAKRAGIRPGDIVTTIGSRPVKTLADFDRTMAELKPGTPVGVTFKHDGAAESATLKVPADSHADR
jgi:uncharacterized protein